jgi:UDP-N-acetylglucosamine--N-acetylmuramyl-(pentapeptide) pyrophosphoryl-undecaprenol N-acetylglucosamine transferase
MALVRRNAAVLVKDAEAKGKMMEEAVALAHDAERIKEMETNIAPLARMDAAMDIAKEVYKLLDK